MGLGPGWCRHHWPWGAVGPKEVPLIRNGDRDSYLVYLTTSVLFLFLFHLLCGGAEPSLVTTVVLMPTFVPVRRSGSGPHQVCQEDNYGFEESRSYLKAKDIDPSWISNGVTSQCCSLPDKFDPSSRLGYHGGEHDPYSLCALGDLHRSKQKLLAESVIMSEINFVSRAEFQLVSIPTNAKSITILDGHGQPSVSETSDQRVLDYSFTSCTIRWSFTKDVSERLLILR